MHRTEAVFMDEPDEAKVVVWKDSLTEDWGIHLEFVKRGRDPEKLSIRISMQNAELAKLAHLIDATIKGTPNAG